MRSVPSSNRLLPLLAISLLVSAACLCSPGGLFPFAPAAPTLAPTLPAPTVVPAGPPAGSASAHGPWLLFAGQGGVRLMNLDGTGATQLTLQPMPYSNSLAASLQPGGTLLAVLSSANDGVHNLTLDLLRLPSGSVEKRIPLTTPATEPGAESMPGDPSFEAVRAVMLSPSLAWSPDGSRLAFIGVLDGPSAEVYLYDLTDDAIRRVSTDEAQNFNPAFSPDGSYLIYFGAATFGTGAGFAMTGVWSAYGDGSNVTWQYIPDSSGEELIGWRDGSTAVLASWNPICGSSDLRLYNLVTTAKEMLHTDCFGSAATSDWGMGATEGVLFSTPQGVFLLPSTSDEVLHYSEMIAHDVRWDSAGGTFIIPFIEMPWHSCDPSGEMCVPAPATVEDAAMFGLIWAWTNASGEVPGVWIGGPGMEIGQIFNQPASVPAWDRRDNTIFFVGGQGGGASLMRATFPSYNDVRIITSLPEVPQQMLWVAGD